jgi:hypothetical protein
MQDRYAGDVGDFGKLGLLRHLCGVTAQDKHARFKKPGVIWYKTIPGTRENAQNHGNFIRFLDESDENNRRFKACDGDLYEALRHVVETGWSIDALQRVLAGQCPDFRAGVPLLPGAVYGSKGVCHGKKRVTCPRADWFQSAFAATVGCDLVFLDPDNGIECADLRPTRGESRKYVFRCEVGKLIKRGQSVVVYHHTGRRGGTAKQQVQWHLKKLRDQLSLAQDPFGVLFHRGGTRDFLILPAQEHYQTLLDRTNTFVTKWGTDEWKTGKPRGHFTGPYPDLTGRVSGGGSGTIGR